LQCNAAWQEKILEAQMLGKKWETQCNSLREKREALHKQMLTSLENCVPAKSTHDTPSIRVSEGISILIETIVFEYFFFLRSQLEILSVKIFIE